MLDDDVAATLRSRLAEIVHQAGSQAAASRALGLSQQTISSILLGHAASDNVIAAMATYLGVPVAELLRPKPTVH